jgi:hypothetical protein
MKMLGCCGLIALLMFISMTSHAESISGKFANGATFQGAYDKSSATVEGGQKVEREKFNLNVTYNGSSRALAYAYDSDGPSQIKSNPLGFISITTHTGSMDGDIISAYIFFDGEKLASLGAVDISLNKNVISGATYVDYNKDATDAQKADFLKGVLESPESLIVSKENIFENASLFLMPAASGLKGSGSFEKLNGIPSVLKAAGYDGYPELFKQKVL